VKAYPKAWETHNLRISWVEALTTQHENFSSLGGVCWEAA